MYTPLYKKWEEAISARRSTRSTLGSGVASFRKVCPMANPTPTAPSTGKIEKQITEEMQAFWGWTLSMFKNLVGTFPWLCPYGSI